MSEDLMRYDLLAQQALRGVVRAALENVARDGLPGDHHFYIAFSTRAPGVQISHRLRERYAEEMTIVLQHQFYGLEVGPERFTVQLHFNNVPETLVVPFAAVKGFYDPSVQFGLQFDITSQAAEASRRRGKSGARQHKAANSQPDSPPPRATPAKTGTGKDAAADGATPAGPVSGVAVGGAQIVSIDQFRNKK
jgi:hypothetical protein